MKAIDTVVPLCNGMFFLLLIYVTFFCSKTAAKTLVNYSFNALIFMFLLLLGAAYKLIRAMEINKHGLKISH